MLLCHKIPFQILIKKPKMEKICENIQCTHMWNTLSILLLRVIYFQLEQFSVSPIFKTNSTWKLYVIPSIDFGDLWSTSTNVI